MSKLALWWDLDGTLVDSAPTILAALDSAFVDLGVTPIEPLSQKLIGPPLHQLLERLFPNSPQVLRERILDQFKHQYDNHACLTTKAFNGVDGLLRKLHQQGIQQRICTNKRLLPTLKIINALGWREIFEGIHALPDYAPCVVNEALSHKSVMIKDLLLSNRFEPSSVMLVGDTADDQRAARSNEVSFCFAAWGYGAIDAQEGDCILGRCEDVLKLLNT